MMMGLRVVQDDGAVRTLPAKAHKKRRGQTDTYHRRIQKKWTKRWGTKTEPAAYLLNNGVLGGIGRTLIVHPSIMAQLKSLPSMSINSFPGM